MSISPEKKYRQSATVIIANRKNQVLICERVQSMYGGVQTVQGGIDSGESPQEAAYRELSEEVGLIERDLFDLHGPLGWTWKYDWPEDYRQRLKEIYKDLFEPIYAGQEQQFFLAQLKTDVTFSLDHHAQEFSRVWWGTPQELIDGIWEPKREGMKRALEEFGLI